jgi:hypothetical protein
MTADNIKLVKNKPKYQYQRDIKALKCNQNSPMTAANKNQGFRIPLEIHLPATKCITTKIAALKTHLLHMQLRHLQLSSQFN